MYNIVIVCVCVCVIMCLSMHIVPMHEYAMYPSVYMSPPTPQSRLAVNSVVLGDCERPFAIAGFVSELAAGFRLLNLKNDALRRKHDALKYDVKKIEEVVYDISIRGLKPAAQQPAETALETS